MCKALYTLHFCLNYFLNNETGYKFFLIFNDLFSSGFFYGFLWLLPFKILKELLFDDKIINLKGLMIYWFKAEHGSYRSKFDRIMGGYAYHINGSSMRAYIEPRYEKKDTILTPL